MTFIAVWVQNVHAMKIVTALLYVCIDVRMHFCVYGNGDIINTQSKFLRNGLYIFIYHSYLNITCVHI